MVDAQLFSLAAQHSRPEPSSDSIVQGDHWRITVLTSRLLRIEWNPSGVFRDRPTQVVMNRDFSDVQFQVEDQDGYLNIETANLHLVYNRQQFTSGGLSVTVKDVDSSDNSWYYGVPSTQNLKGTVRTLDGADGAVELDEGILSRNGWSVLDDSGSMVLTEDSRNPFGTWVKPRQDGVIDLYFFGYGHRYKDAIQDYYKLTGSTPLLPRFALGNWWSRYHRYDEKEYEGLVQRFEKEEIPITTAVIDMDWHLVNIDHQYGSGWTGFTWNRELFPKPKSFLDFLHAHGLKATLNVHPRDGIRAYEDAYKSVAEYMGIDPLSKKSVDFDLTNPKFMEAYFDLVYRPLEEEGVDFWWLDWQQGGITRMAGLDPLWMLNYLHYLDSAHTGQRALTFSRYAGPGSHRYPIGFSGDTLVTWESLSFQPYFTATASNIGYGWWSHDIGGHIFGYRDEDLEARWYQLGVFSPILRLHSSDSPFNGKEPWNFHGEVRESMSYFLRLRQRLLPYLYSMNRRAAYDNLPLVEPMYWNYPEQGQAYQVPNESMFGSELLVVPITKPTDKHAHRGEVDAWLPQGEWFDFFDGRHYQSLPEAGRRMQIWRDILHMPVFAKAGAIVPMQNIDSHEERINSTENPKNMDVVVFPGADGHFSLWEDDGATQDRVQWAKTDMVLHWGKENRVSGDCSITIDAADGHTDSLPARRNWRILFRGVEDCDVVVALDGNPIDADKIEQGYDAETMTTSIAIKDCPTSSTLTIGFADAVQLANDPTVHDAYEVLNRSEMLYRSKDEAYELIRHQGRDVIASLGTIERDAKYCNNPDEVSHLPHAVLGALIEVFSRNL
ncbi:TIM-barrel domain-containing protein [Bifidobacterium aquikefiri]|uniref:glycoside hydrolase family 31 protein n=1 Tax=Bifidobacterium aquikefiri TaxID=1653207 RepID=UPI0039ED76F9